MLKTREQNEKVTADGHTKRASCYYSRMTEHKSVVVTVVWYTILAINESTFHYQVSFVVDNVEHDDDDGDGDKVRHEMT